MCGRASHLQNRLPLLLGLLSLALALLACNLAYPVGGPLPAATSDLGAGGLAGRLWHDRCASPGDGQPTPATPPPGCLMDPAGGLQANAKLDPGEEGIAGVGVRLGEGGCPATGLQKALTDSDGLFLFAGLPAGSYCVSIDPHEPVNAALLQPGRWTYPPALNPNGPIQVEAILEQGELRTDLFFAWDYALRPPYEPPPSETPTMTPSPAPTAILPAEPSATPTLTPTATLTPTPTLPPGDPRDMLRQPAWVEHFEDASDWALYEDTHARFELGEAGLVMTAFNPDYFNSWILTWRRADNLYLEVTGTMGACAGRDSFGLMFRASRSDQGYVGYLFGVSCDGSYALRAWDGESMKMITAWTRYPSLPVGGNAERRIGVWAEGNTLRLYGQGELLAELTDGRYAAGLFGLYVGAAQTANFTVTVRELAYWDLP